MNNKSYKYYPRESKTLEEKFETTTCPKCGSVVVLEDPMTNWDSYCWSLKTSCGTFNRIVEILEDVQLKAKVYRNTDIDIFKGFYSSPLQLLEKKVKSRESDKQFARQYIKKTLDNSQIGA